MAELVSILSKKYINHDVLEVVLEKPASFSFIPGQAVNIAINKENWIDQIRTYAITSNPEDDYIEILVKIYPEGIGGGFLQELEALPSDATIWIHDVIGTVTFKGEGVFIAGGVGITPFISILRRLERTHKVGNNKLIFANKNQEDILFEEGLKELLGANVTLLLSDEKREGYSHGYVSKNLLETYLEGDHQYFYLCGPKPMTDVVEVYLSELGVDPERIVIERF